MKYNPEQIYARFIDMNKALQNNKYYPAETLPEALRISVQQNEYRLKNLEVKFSELLEFMIEQSKTPFDSRLENQIEPPYTPCNHDFLDHADKCIHCGESLLCRHVYVLKDLENQAKCKHSFSFRIGATTTCRYCGIELNK